MVFPMLALVVVAGLLTVESWLPGQVFLPLSFDDFPAWSAGQAEEDSQAHPHPNWTMSDVLHLLLPGLRVTKEALSRGEAPLWDPSQALGLPHVDQVHYSVLYPPAWIPLALGLNGLALLAWLHLVIAGAGMLVYLRSLKRSTIAAATGTLAFVCSAWITARLHSFPVVGAAVWMPWVMWGLQRGAETGRPRYYLGAAVALALSMLAGFPQVTLLVASTAGLFELVRLARGLSTPKAAILQCSAGLATLALGAALSAVQVLPTLEYMSNDSARADQDPAVIAKEGLEWPLMAHLVAPDYLADAGLAGPHPMALGQVKQAVLPAAVNRAETSMSVGVVALILALLTMVFGRTWVSRTWTVVVIVVFTLLLWPDLLAQAAAVLPPLQYGNPKRLLLVSTFGLAVLAAGGVDVLRRSFLRITSLGWLLSFAFTAWVVTLMIAVPSAATSGDVDNWALRLAQGYGLSDLTAEQFYEMAGMPPESFVRASGSALRSTLIALLASLTGLLFFRPRSQPTQAGWSCLARQAPVVLTAAMTLELVVSAFPLLRSVPSRSMTNDSSQLMNLRTSTLVNLVRGCRRETAVPPRLARVGNEPPFLRPNFPGLFGLHDLQAYAPMAPRRTIELLGSIAPGTTISGSQIGGFSSAAELMSPVVDMLGVAAVLTQEPELMPDGFTEVGAVGHVRVLRNDEVFPRAWTLTNITIIDVKNVRLNRIKGKTFDLRSMAVLDEIIEWPPGKRFRPDPNTGRQPPVDPDSIDADGVAESEVEPAPANEDNDLADDEGAATVEDSPAGDSEGAATGEDGPAGDNQDAPTGAGSSEGEDGDAGREDRNYVFFDASAVRGTLDAGVDDRAGGEDQDAAAAGENPETENQDTAGADDSPAVEDQDTTSAGPDTDIEGQDTANAGDSPESDELLSAGAEDIPEADDQDGADAELGAVAEPGAAEVLDEGDSNDDGELTDDDAESADDEELEAEEAAPTPADLADVEPFSARAVVIDSYVPGRIELRVGPGPDTVLIVAESWSASWVALVDGQVVPVVRANHALIGLPVPAGEEGSTVTLEYIEPAPVLGLGVAAAALALFGVVAFFTTRRARRAVVAASQDSAA
jgi:hypothetical protein